MTVQLPGVSTPLRMETMLRTCAVPIWVVVAFPLSLVLFKRVVFLGCLEGVCDLGVVLH